jgi:hypothetical protein
MVRFMTWLDVLGSVAGVLALGVGTWWVNAADPVSLRGGVLEILRLLDAPAAVQREVQDGAATAADRFWSFLGGGARRGVLVFDNADVPAVLGRRQLCASRGRNGLGAGSRRDPGPGDYARGRSRHVGDMVPGEAARGPR